MKIKLNSKIISIPPYISTSWMNISSIHSKNNILHINLFDGETVEIPNLPNEITDAIFDTHSEILEEDIPEMTAPETEDSQTTNIPPFLQNPNLTGNNGLPFQIGIEGMEGFGSLMQHNSAQKNAPDLPQEMLDKITAISKIVAPEEMQNIPKPEPHCNCFHCQIARAISDQPVHFDNEDDYEEVSDEELSFQQWDIEHVNEHLYTVTNRLNNEEKYNVHLKDPVGCTCGKKDCEHIVAVLQS